MKRLPHLLLIALVLVAISWAIWRGFSSHRVGSTTPEEIESAKGEPEESAPEDGGVILKREQVKALGIITSPLEKVELTPRRVAFGHVLDPTPLVTLDNDLTAAEVAIAPSRAEFERTQKLLAAGENASRKTFETAEGQFRADEIKLNNLRRQATLQWGSVFPFEESVSRRAFIETLVRGEIALIRVDLLPSDAVTELPKAARVIVLGREQQPVEATRISPSTDADARTQAQGFIILVETPPFAMRPGMALTAWLELTDKPRPGFLLPRSSVLRHDGRTWVFLQEKEGEYLRKPIALDSPLENGWFIEVEGGGLEKEDLIVTTGSQVLLSEELKATAGSAEGE